MSSIHAFPISFDKTLPAFKKIESLLKATHALSFYRLVLKQGEPFSPVVLRVHSDPISIIGKVLEQNPEAYTKIQEFLEVGANMVRAGLYANKHRKPANTPDEEESLLFMSEKRVTAMCIEAALREDDFETAYSYVASRLGASPSTPTPTTQTDNWSWNAALKAGQYIRNPQSVAPTHLGTASGNPAIRHLEQRAECLSTALRIAPPSELHGILEAYGKCEEKLDAAVREEAEEEAAWDAEADLHSPGMPGAFASGPSQHQHRRASQVASRRAEDVPMSLFDLSRATARVATRNLGVLSSLGSVGSASHRQEGEDVGTEHDEQKMRKRDQLRDAAMGTLVSGVGWLINAPARGEGGS